MHLSKKAEDIERMREPNSSLFSILWGNIMEPKLCYIKEEYFAERKLADWNNKYDQYDESEAKPKRSIKESLKENKIRKRSAKKRRKEKLRDKKELRENKKS